jgi:glycerol-3-phosphate dehydrogenase
MNDSNPEEVETLVVGGVNGTSVAAELKDRGYDDFVVADPEGYGRRLTD